MENLYFPGLRFEINQAEEVFFIFCSCPLLSSFMVKAREESVMGVPLSLMRKEIAGVAEVGETGC